MVEIELPLNPISLINQVLEYVYEYLSSDSRVIRPGSIRSYEAAAADIYFRILLEGGNIDEDKLREIITRVGIQNLLLSVETQNPEEKKLILEEAFEYALNRILRGFENLAKQGHVHKRREIEQKQVEDKTGSEVGGSLKARSRAGAERRLGEKGEEESNLDVLTSSMNEDISLSGLRQGQATFSGKSVSLRTTGEIVNTQVEEVSTNDEMEQMISTIYEAFYGGVGTVNFMNLAQLINMFVRYDANIIKKVQVLKKLEKYLRGYGLVGQTTYTKLTQGEKKILEEFRRRTRGYSSDMAQMKVIKFVGSDRYPTYVVNMREFKFGDNYSNIDLYKTAINISRKSLMGKMITSRDIVVKEYANVKSIDLVLCLDVSGSMRELSWGIQKIDIAKDAVSKYVQFLTNTNDKLALILFNFRADVLWTLHQVKKYWKYMLYLLSYVYAGGGTNLAHALERAREVLSKSKSSAKHIVCVTDGRTVNAQLCIREVMRLRRQGATVSTIAIGENSDDDLLMKISRMGGGLFIKISNIHDLSKALIIDKLHFL